MAFWNLLWDNLAVIWSLTVFFSCLVLVPTLRSWLRVYLLIQKLPGPKGHPLWGNAAEFLSKQKFFEHAARWREQFPTFHKTLLFFHPTLIMQSPDAVQLVLARNKHGAKGLIYKGLRPLLGEGLITSKGERWHSHRKLITPTFHFNILESFVDVFVNRTNDFMKQLDRIDKSDFIDVSPYTQKLTLDFICETAMGTPIQAQHEAGRQSKIVGAMHKLEEIGIYRMVRPWLLSDTIFKWTAKGTEQDKYKNILHSFTEKVIQERREALRQKQKEGELVFEESATGRKKAIFMDLLIESSENGSLLSDQDIREEVNTFMFAGQNTTQLAINFCLYLLGLSPAIQEKAQQELDNIFGTSQREPTMEDLKEMRYLERCIKEALRLFPSVPVIGRRLTHDENLGKHLLPKNADVLIIPYVLHRDPQHFPNPEEFNPDNFLPENVKNRHPYAYIPFSAGPRNCIGQKFAILAEKTVLSAILRKYIVTSKHKREELIVVPNTVLVPKTGIRLKFTHRCE